MVIHSSEREYERLCGELLLRVGLTPRQCHFCILRKRNIEGTFARYLTLRRFNNCAAS